MTSGLMMCLIINMSVGFYVTVWSPCFCMVASAWAYWTVVIIGIDTTWIKTQTVVYSSMGYIHRSWPLNELAFGVVILGLVLCCVCMSLGKLHSTCTTHCPCMSYSVVVGVAKQNWFTVYSMLYTHTHTHTHNALPDASAWIGIQDFLQSLFNFDVEKSLYRTK